MGLLELRMPPAIYWLRGQRVNSGLKKKRKKKEDQKKKVVARRQRRAATSDTAVRIGQEKYIHIYEEILIKKESTQEC